MEYDFKFVLRSDDYHPVLIRLRDTVSAIVEILYLDDAARFLSVSVDASPEGTGNLCLFAAKIESDNPASWLNAAQTYASLRYLEEEVSIAEYKEPEIVEEAEPVEEPALVEEPIELTDEDMVDDDVDVENVDDEDEEE
jgi:hypothetical protein